MLQSSGSGTDVAVVYGYQPKFGFLGELMGRLMLDGQLTKGYTGFLKDLDRTARGALCGCCKGVRLVSSRTRTQRFACGRSPAVVRGLKGSGWDSTPNV